MTLGLQAFRFSIYIVLPVVATVVYSHPPIMHQIVQQLNYVIYPAEGERPPVGDEIEKHRKR